MNREEKKFQFPNKGKCSECLESFNLIHFDTHTNFSRDIQNASFSKDEWDAFWKSKVLLYIEKFGPRSVNVASLKNLLFDILTQE